MMKNLKWSYAIPPLVAILLFVIITLSYFSPMLEGKALRQHDISQYKGASKEIVDFRAKYHKEPLWTNSMFGGMPAYLISVHYPSNLIRYVNRFLSLGFKSPAVYLFLSMMGFYFLLVVGFRMNPWLGIVGAIGFGFSSYFFQIEVAGHNTKALAMSYMAPMITGVILAFRGKWMWGGLITGLFLSLQLLANHYQITYYSLLTVVILGIIYLIHAIIEKKLPFFLKTFGVLVVAVLLAVGSNITSIWLIKEYGKVSIRGKSELSTEKENRTSGLDRDYILNDYSYGIDETLNLLIPNFKGGASSGFDLSSKTYAALKGKIQNAKQLVQYSPLAYWGTQRFVAGPVYIGAVIIFLFFMSLFLVKGPEKWWLVIAIIISLVLAWGKNLSFVSDFFIHYVPGYNKFRTVSMTLVIAEFAIPLLAMMGINKLIQNHNGKEEVLKAVKYSLYVVGGITLFFALFPGLLYHFSAPIDEQLKSSGWPDTLLQAIRDDRKHLMQADALRSFIFVVLSAGLILGLIYKKIKVAYFIPAMALLILADLWPIDKRYLNENSFAPKREVTTPFLPTPADLSILKDPDPDYRVMNLSVSTFNDASTSYFHKSIGGYHGAKLRRYQELVTYQISKNNQQVLDMLNTKYFIVPGQGNQASAQLNPGALGNAWFVNRVKWASSADEEINALSDFNAGEEAIVNKRFTRNLKGFSFQQDSLSQINLKTYKPNELVYTSETRSEALAIFSEIYYEKGWNAYIDGKQVPYFRADYVLRALRVPAGNHTITFRFHPRAYYTGEKISLASSLILLLLLAGMIGFEILNFFRNTNAGKEKS